MQIHIIPEYVLFLHVECVLHEAHVLQGVLEVHPGYISDRHTSRLVDTDSHSMDIVTSVFAPFFTHDARLASLVLRWVLSMSVYITEIILK